MVSQMWLDAINGFAQLWGLPPEVMLFIVGVIYAIGFAAGVTKLAGGSKSMAATVFLLILFVEAAIGMLDWIFLFIPLIFVMGLMLKTGGFP